MYDILDKYCTMYIVHTVCSIQKVETITSLRFNLCVCRCTFKAQNAFFDLQLKRVLQSFNLIKEYKFWNFRVINQGLFLSSRL
jgi:hypothetical protein